MFEEYKKEVLAYYFLKKEQNQLSSNLESPGRLKLKRECLRIFAEKYTKKDDEMLKAFFDPQSKFNDHIKSIEKFELDKFRPLVNFLQRETNIRDEESVKLLAWLISFDSYRNWRCKEDKEVGEWALTVLGGDDQISASEDVLSENTGEERAATQSGTNHMVGGASPVITKTKAVQENSRPSLIKRMMMTGIAFFVFGGAVFYLSGYQIVSSVREPLPDEKCMYWTGDHYEPVQCDRKIKDAVLIPLNPGILHGLQKINETDTLTKYSLGKVWYSKVGGKHEFFTDSGAHPVDTLKRLRPLTKYILSNYVSYHRYLLIRLVWSICATITAGLLISVIYLFRRQTKIRI